MTDQPYHNPNQPQPTPFYPGTDPQPEPPTPTARKRPAWRIPAIAVGVLAVFAAGWIAGATYTRSGGFTPGSDAFAEAQTKCDPNKIGTVVADEGRTLTVDGKGEDDIRNDQGLPVEGLVCILDTLKMPAAVRDHLAQTRALDGRQTGSWEGFTASWSYHPNSGTNLIVEVK